MLKEEIDDIDNTEKKMEKKHLQAEEIVDIDNYKQ